MTADADARAAIEALGAEVARRWQACSFHTAEFAAVAVDALRDARLHEHVDPDAFVDRLFGREAAGLPTNRNPDFSDASLTLFSHPGFWIEALFWVEGISTIHDHQFGGAFSLLRGQSIEVRHAYSEQRRVNDLLGWGELAIESIQLLQTGVVCSIEPGAQLIHSVFHLERPSVSIVVRTTQIDGPPQREYHHAGVARASFRTIPLVRQQVRHHRVGLMLDHERALARLCTQLARCDAYTAFELVWALRPLLHASGGDHAVSAALDARDDDVGPRTRACADEVMRAAELLRLRAGLADPDVRLLLALLLNAPSREIFGPRSRFSPEGGIHGWVARALGRLAAAVPFLRALGELEAASIATVLACETTDWGRESAARGHGHDELDRVARQLRDFRPLAVLLPPARS